MDYSDINSKVIFFEDRILYNFDKYFNYLVLEDFYTGGHEDRIDDEWFYEEYFEEYEKGLINLLMDIEDKGEEYYNLQLRLIKLKRIIDTKLNKINKNDEESYPKRRKRISYLILNENIDSDRFIELLYNKLNHKNFINCSISDFRNLFTDVSERKKIQWTGTESQITFFINKLIIFLDKESGNNKYELITRLFINRNSKKFKPKQLSTVYSERGENIASDDPLRDLFKYMSTNI